MATVAKTFSRALRSSPKTRLVRPGASFAVGRQTFQQSRRGYSSEAPGSSSSSSTYIYGGIAVLLLGGGGYYAYSLQDGKTATPAVFTPSKEDYQKVYDAVAKRLIDEDNYDDGSYGPVIIRLGWHASGTYDAATGTGGSNGATMRFAPESDHGANAGLKAAREFLEPVRAQFPWITYSDLWTLSTVCAVQEMGGPVVPWRPGRNDRDVAYCTPDGRLPDGALGQDHLRAIFGRMGFNDQEIVALSGAHALGRCHTDRSGFDGPWTFSPTVLTNDYYKLLLDEKWSWKKWNGPKQYADNKTKTLMMLPTDMALIKDKAFKPFVQKYADDQDVFFRDFSNVVMKLLELGVPFQSGEDARIEFKRSE